mgnify:CR=1 FL=1
MAVIHLCDGCGTVIDKPNKVGVVTKRDYCAECEAKARAFLAAEDALRAQCQARFAAERQALIDEHGGFKLPDVP